MALNTRMGIAILVILVQAGQEVLSAGLPTFKYDSSKSEAIGKAASGVLYEATLICLKNSAIEEVVKRATCEVGASYLSQGQYTVDCGAVAKKAGEAYAKCMKEEVPKLTKARILDAFGVTMDPPGHVPTAMDIMVKFGKDMDMTALQGTVFAKIPGLPELLKDFTDRCYKEAKEIQDAAHLPFAGMPFTLPGPPKEADSTSKTVEGSYMSYLNKIKIATKEISLDKLLDGANFLKDKACDIVYDLAKQQFLEAVKTGPLSDVGSVLKGIVQKEKVKVDADLNKALEKDKPEILPKDMDKYLDDKADTPENKKELDKIDDLEEINAIKLKLPVGKEASEEDVKRAAKQAIVACATLHGSDEMHLLFCHNQIQAGKHAHMAKLLKFIKDYDAADTEKTATKAINDLEASLVEVAKSKLWAKGKGFAECLDEKAKKLMPADAKHQAKIDEYIERGDMHRKVKMDLCGWWKVHWIVAKYLHDYAGKPYRQAIRDMVNFAKVIKDKWQWSELLLIFGSAEEKK